MKQSWCILSMVVLAVVVGGAIALAADQPTDQTIGPKMEIKKGTTGQSSAGSAGEAMTGGLGPGTEKPMRAPDSEGRSDFDLKNMIVPDQADFEAARESDSRSLGSF